MRRPTRPYPTRTTCSDKYFSSVAMGNAAKGSTRPLKLPCESGAGPYPDQQRFHGRKQQRVDGDRDQGTGENQALSFDREVDLAPTPSPAKMKENSPICARLADTVSAVVNG